MNGTSHEGDEETLRKEDESGKPAGPNDASAPIEGAKRSALDSADLTFAIYEQLPEKDRAKFAEDFQKGQPAQIAAARQRRRERIRFWLTLLLVFGILLDGFAALYVAVWAKSASWDTAKDWLAYSLAPLVAMASIAAAFWWPSKEAE